MWPPGALWSAACLLATMAARGQSSTTPGQSESIMDMINTKEVEKFLAQRAENASREERRFLQQNALEDSEVDDDDDGDEVGPPRPDKAPFKPLPPPKKVLPELGSPDPQARRRGNSSLAADHIDKLLRSSKSALEVTTRDYLKRDWCKTEPLVQRVREEGCISRTIVNRFCYGQCNSFYIPKNPRRRRSRRRDQESGDVDEVAAAFKSCAFCKPKLASWITVTLHCPSSVPALRRKRVQRIKQCKCIAQMLN